MSDIQAEEQLVEEELDQDAEQATPDSADVEAEQAPEDEAEVIVSIGDESPPPEEVEQAQAPAWVKELRKNHRELQKKNRELEERLKVSVLPELKVELGTKPKLEDCDYDTDKYEEEIFKWHERKRSYDEQANKEKEKQAAAEKAWQDTLDGYAEGKLKLKVDDYEEAEHVVQGMLSKTQQGIILQGAKNPALVVYALGKYQAKAKEFAAITDPVKYAFAIANWESELKVTKRSVPAPEKAISSKGGATYSGALDSALDKLRTEAERTGDYSKVMDYKRRRKT